MIPVSKNVYIARISVAIGQIVKKLYIYIYIYIMIQCFPKPYNGSIRNTKELSNDASNELELSNDATKADLKAGTDVGASNLAAVSDLASLKFQVDKKRYRYTKTCCN